MTFPNIYHDITQCTEHPPLYGTDIMQSEKHSSKWLLIAKISNDALKLYLLSLRLLLIGHSENEDIM